MSIVNFSIPNVLEKRVDQTIQKKGFASKAEFFRFAAVHFIDQLEKPVMTDDDESRLLTEAVKQAVIKRYKGHHIPSAREQLADI